MSEEIGVKAASINDTPKYVPPTGLGEKVIVFLNSSSGGRMGPKVLEKVRDMIPESQIFDLNEVRQKKWIPEDKLREYQDIEGIKVLICGGDGTMGWILSCIDRLGPAAAAGTPKFPVAIMPLGTGNDLARSFGWGPGFSNAMLQPQFLEKVKKASPSKLDRWLLSVMPYTPLGDDEVIKSTNIPATFSVHKYSSALAHAGNHFGMVQEPPQNKRTQSVLRMGRSFSVRMSSQANAVHTQEMNRSSSVGHSSLHGQAQAPHPQGSKGGVGDSETLGMARSSSAPSTVKENSSLSVSEISAAVLSDSGEEEDIKKANASSTALPRSGAGAGETVLASDGAGEKKEDDLVAAVAAGVTGPLERIPKRKGPLRAMPSISVIQRFETWESYDAVFCNYFSFGVDAVAASAFHEHRNAHPELFTSRWRNQTWYARKGFPAAGGIPCSGNQPPPPIHQYLKMSIKRTPESDWEPIEMESSMRGMVVLNLQSYGGGRNLWGTANPGCSQMQYAPPALDDGLLEIVGIGSILKLGCIMGFNKVGVRATRLCQAAEVELRMLMPIHMQIDGEPWLQAPAKVNIKSYGQSTCLRGG